MTDSSTRMDRDEDIAAEARIEEDLARPDTRPPAAPPPARGKPRGRRIGFLLLGAVVLLAAIAYLVLRLTAPPAEETDDAYVGGDAVTITARDGGTVLGLHADNTQQVTRGQPLIDLDPASLNAARDAAEAALGRAVRAVRSNSAQVDEAGAEIVSARADLARARDDFNRRKAAAADGAISGEELSHARDAVTTAEAALNLANARRAQAASTVQGTSVYDNPQVLAAIAEVRQAAINSSHAHIVAPVSGVVAQRTVQLGQRVAPGTPLMAVVPMDSLWVDANFRETQLQHLRVGQPAEITADVYGGAYRFHGRVVGLGAGSGSAFSLLPPQNASGNWIKIVQRVPVRIALDPAELRAHPLRIGLSVNVTVSTADRSGPFVAGARPPAGGMQQSLTGGPEVEARIRRIIAENMGQGR
ncbi:efflux RND transporter periplasmic adaptor subunit [Sphingomonas morindae]|uniref:Efflux RND transporter periplasmic adaptor subunit n=1 Tax=Sphingomonas morindae TaxID=1541170 RepID=A0ABY4X6I7_9SPHN|nr:efflux RND transporter periplasmic adaptor subunit [Sphingomonas morindae]USI72520.1 efflux RND transporter periplasmic adaptor subunit [Sphingomonas morindae]